MIHDKPHNESKCGHGWCGRTRFPLKPENQGRHELHRNSTATNKHELGPWPVISGVYVTQLRPMYLIRDGMPCEFCCDHVARPYGPV